MHLFICFFVTDLVRKMSNSDNGSISGYADTGKYWRSFYESSTFENDLQDLLKQLQPLYQNLHTYVRNKLTKLYGEENFPESGHIPAHLLGKVSVLPHNSKVQQLLEKDF